MKAYITDCDHESLDIEKDVFSKTSIDLEILNITKPNDIIHHCRDADVLILQYAEITEDVLNTLDNLKGVVRYGVGVNTIDISAATKKGIAVCNVPDYGTEEVSTHALALILALARKLPLLTQATRQGIWRYDAAIPLYRLQTQTVGIIGLGRIGVSLSQKLAGIGMKVIGYDPNKKSTDLPAFIKSVSLNTLLQTSDIISVNSPLLPETNNLLTKNEFSLMKQHALVVNTARGDIINEDDLFDALKNNVIAGAALDVFSQEPPKESRLLTLDNFIATPHIAWYSEESQQDLKRKAAEEAIRIVLGESPHYCLNR